MTRSDSTGLRLMNHGSKRNNRSNHRMVALPGQLFYSTQIPACLWFIARGRDGGRFRDHRGGLLFMDARKLGCMVDRTHREFNSEDMTRIADTHYTWRGSKNEQHEDVPDYGANSKQKRQGWMPKSRRTSICWASVLNDAKPDGSIVLEVSCPSNRAV